jgi:hypothetical protein
MAAVSLSRPPIENLFKAIAGYEIYSAQFNLSCVGLETLPTNVLDALARRSSTRQNTQKLNCPRGPGRSVWRTPILQSAVTV